MHTEQWVSVRGYEGLYEVSNLGRVRSMDRVAFNAGIRKQCRLKGRVLKQRADKDGYSLVELSNCSVATTCKVHRLVASAFLATPADAQDQVNHRNLRKSDNAATNLEWATCQENHDHAKLNGRLPAVRRTRVVASHLETGERREFASVVDAAKAGFNRGAVHKCLAGTWREHRGYQWSRA